jgi:integrase
MPLSDVTIRNAKPRAKPYKLADGGGMYLEVAPSGGKWWRLKYRIGGKEKRLSLGVYPETPLAGRKLPDGTVIEGAREKRDNARKLIASGIDPSQHRKDAQAAGRAARANTFEAIARAWIDHQGDRWEAITKERALASLENDVFPAIGARPISEIRPTEVTAAIKAIEKRGAGEAASRVLQRVRATFRYAVAHEYITVNPMAEIKPGELLKARQVTHRPALALKDLPDFLARLAAYEGDPSTKNALRLLMLSAVRPGELRGALWEEFDLPGKQWRIPAERMKMKEEHIVPLSTQALEILESMRPLSGDDALVFPSPFYPGKPLSENTFNSALARMGYKGSATAHGFRALFSTVANECGWDADVIERQLAHIERNQVRAAYHRAQYLEQRTTLMQWWADFMDAKATGTNVIPLRAA